ncbi:MAG: hypothetical protein QW717_04165 [Candidatus Bathyarchaeia archaeon]
MITVRSMGGFSLENSNSSLSFDEILLEAIDEALAMLGDSCKHAFYLYLEKAFKIGKQEIPSKIEEFTKAIEQIFGLGSKLIEIHIMKSLRRKISYFTYFANHELTFQEYVNTAKKLHLKNKTITVKSKIRRQK